MKKFSVRLVAVLVAVGMMAGVAFAQTTDSHVLSFEVELFETLEVGVVSGIAIVELDTPAPATATLDYSSNSGTGRTIFVTTESAGFEVSGLTVTLVADLTDATVEGNNGGSLAAPMTLSMTDFGSTALITGIQQSSVTGATLRYSVTVDVTVAADTYTDTVVFTFQDDTP